MICPNHEICDKWFRSEIHPGGSKFKVLEQVGTCFSYDYTQCMYLFKIHSTKLPILIVDDEEAMCTNLTRMMLDTYGQDVVVFPANTFCQACQLVEHKFFPIVFLDIRLPDGSGLELLEDVKKESPSTTVVMITSFDRFTELISQAKMKGAAECLGKPFSYDQIREVLNKYVPRLIAAYNSVEENK